ncbi:angiopoietin-related protein 1-like [Pomacea canaliculata]|uniref:angiopoietin-related protein 1-like n=1 Tax=Pomacea canaliculata TaxID=400727 RepID=UPI000D72A9CC|nr:angiopoietin-related protein 1-like [Pomacea canaliculata]
MVLPTNNITFPINCFNEYSTVMIRRNNKINFTRSWREYREGFGNLSETHWLGLEQIHLLTSQNRSYRLVVQVEQPNGTLLQAAYNNFKVKDEKSLYQFTFDSIKLSPSPAGDCLSDLRGANFSTYDSDNDGDSSVNCASRHSGGWWFRGNTCSTCNPTGQLLQPANGLRTGVDSEVFWIKDLGNVAPYRISMRLRPL